jgi:hypothetical protein
MQICNILTYLVSLLQVMLMKNKGLEEFNLRNEGYMGGYSRHYHILVHVAVYLGVLPSPIHLSPLI